jgi:prophage DNA circulation protein
MADNRSWEERVRQAAYTSPSGKRVKFDFEDVGREVTKRTAAFEFPNVDDAYVQDNGFGSRRYPLRCIFSGRTHDLEATAFEAALLERGVGKLEHPFYGPQSETMRGRTWTPMNVVPFGDVTRRDDLKSAANQTIVEVTFWTTLPAIYPSSERAPRNEILAALDNFDLAAAQQFASSVDLAGTLNKANAKAGIRKFLKDVSSALGGISDGVTAVNREFRDLQATVNEGIDVFIGQPLLLARQISNLITAPGRALAGIESRLAQYQQLADSIFGSSQANPADTLIGTGALALRTTKIANDFQIAQHFAASTVAGAVVAVTENTFSTRPDAIAAADTVLALFDELVANRDTGFAALQTIDGLAPSQIDTGDAYQALQAAVLTTVGFLVEISFSLIPERRIVLDRARTIVDLCAELYGTVDDKLDFLINTNDLTGDEILELPRGRAIKYYVAA